jgi:hypothetical protein
VRAVDSIVGMAKELIREVDRKFNGVTCNIVINKRKIW